MKTLSPGHSPLDPSLATMRMLNRIVRLFFSRHDPELAQALSVDLARYTATPGSLDDPVRTWEPWMQTDRGLGRARRLQRLINSPVWHDESAGVATGAAALDAAADHLFAAVMNLVPRMPLSEEAHLFRLWYLASHAATTPEKARRLFGDLRDLPLPQQIAAGAQLLLAVSGGAPLEGTSRPRLSSG